MHLLRTLAICGLTMALTVSVHAQTHLLEKVRLNDATTSKGITIDKPSGLSTGQVLNFPSAAGAVDQVLGIANVSGNSIDLGWTSAGGSSTTLSDRLATSQNVTFGTEVTAASVTANSNTNYRITGVLRGHRAYASGSPSDNLAVKLTAPTGSSYALIAVRCTNCASATTGLPTAATGATTATTTYIDPAGSTSSDFGALTLPFEGFVKIGGTAGTVSIALVDDGAGSNGLTLINNSYLLLTEVE